MKYTILTVAVVAVSLAVAMPAFAADVAALDLRPIVRQPEPLNNLHPKLQWMAKQRIRAIWMGDDLFAKSEDGPRTKGKVIADAGFNLAILSMSVNTDGKPTADLTKPYDVKYDRTRSTDIETRLQPNVKEARRDGLHLAIEWQYGCSHLEPYRKYRSPKGPEAKLTCCPLDEKYILGQHLGKWAEALAKGGADGMIVDMEMYQSDTSWPEGACVCDDCFAKYLQKYAIGDWKGDYDQVAPEDRGKWLEEQKATSHYNDFASKRMEALYDTIRAKCQKHNSAFFFGVAPQMYHMPGNYHLGAPVERGFGTAKVPCLVLSEHEYPLGPYRGSYLCMKAISEGLPAMYLPGSYVAMVGPEKMGKIALMSSLYCNGWWAWYGSALLNKTGADDTTGIPYGRAKGTSAQDYLNQIASAHHQLDELLTKPRSQWPERMDGMPEFQQAQIAEAEATYAKTGREEDRKALEDAKASLANYMELVKQGGY